MRRRDEEIFKTPFRKTPRQLEVEREIRIMRKAADRIFATRESAIEFLQRAGIVDENGDLVPDLRAK